LRVFNIRELSEPLLGGDKKKIKKDNEGFLLPRWHGYVYQFFDFFLITVNQTAGKYMFLRNPNMNAF
jgi:hypothetical protein